MNSQLHDWWGRERMREMHEDAARRVLVRCLRRPLSLALAGLLMRLGRTLARRAAGCRPPKQLSAAVNRVLAAQEQPRLPHDG